MKISKYTRLICDKDRYFVYNSLSNFFGQIEEELYTLLSQKENNHLSADELNTESVEILMKKNIITENDDDDILKYAAVIKGRRNIANSLHLTIAPTMDCNFSCPYCFETKEKGKMDDATIKNIIEFVKNQSHVNAIRITWFGGEPLLYPDVVEKISEGLAAACTIPVSAKIITNGYFLNEKNIALLEKAKVNAIQLTIDGLPETHNKIKFTKTDNNTFETVLNNIDTFSKLNSSVTLAVRVNIDKNNQQEFYKLHAFFADRYRHHKNIFLVPAFITATTKKPCKDSCLISNVEKFSIFKDFAQIMNKTNMIYPNNSIHECAARNSTTWAIAPNGDLYKCWEIIGNRKYKIGELTEEGVKITDHKQYNRYLYGADPFEDTSCNQCYSLPICGGGCPHKRIENKFNNQDYDLCTHFKENIDDYLLLRYNYTKP